MTKYSKPLTQKQIEQMKQLYVAENVSTTELAKRFKTTYYRVQGALEKGQWKKHRADFDIEKRVKISDKAVERAIETSRTKDDEHKDIARNAVQVARALLRLVSKQLIQAEQDPTKIDALTVQRSINALKEAVNLERVTHNLPTGVLKSDVTSGGEPIQGSLTSLFDNSEIIQLAKELGIDVKYFKGLAVRIADDASSERQSED